VLCYFFISGDVYQVEVEDKLMHRVEITGPTDRKMVINALNSGAKTFMADLEGKFPLGYEVE
jgi:malate synthase